MIKIPYTNSCAVHLTSISSRILTTTRAVILLSGFTDLHSALFHSVSYLYHEIPLISTVLFSNRCTEYLNLHTCISLPPPGINARYSYNVSHITTTPPPQCSLIIINFLLSLLPSLARRPQFPNRSSLPVSTFHTAVDK